MPRIEDEADSNYRPSMPASRGVIATCETWKRWETELMGQTAIFPLVAGVYLNVLTHVCTRKLREGAGDAAGQVSQLREYVTRFNGTALLRLCDVCYPRRRRCV